MESIWSRETSIEPRKPLYGDKRVNTVIIGGGLAGILTAYHLKQKGIEAIVLEASRIGSGQTKNTTAKITSQHGAVYHKLIKTFGQEKQSCTPAATSRQSANTAVSSRRIK